MVNQFSCWYIDNLMCYISIAGGSSSNLYFTHGSIGIYFTILVPSAIVTKPKLFIAPIVIWYLCQNINNSFLRAKLKIFHSAKKGSVPVGNIFILPNRVWNSLYNRRKSILLPIYLSLQFQYYCLYSSNISVCIVPIFLSNIII